jgi:hypothetical protein
MSEAPDPLEAELAALRPQEVSPGLRRRLARRLAEAPPAKGRRRWRLALAGGLAAACLAVVLLWWANTRRDQPKPVVGKPRPQPRARVADAEPTVRDYQRALARSPEDLDVLLNRQAKVAPKPRPESVPLRAFTRSEAALNALLGED